MVESLFFKLRVLAFVRTKLYKSYVKNLVLQKKKSSDVPDGSKLLRIPIFY